MSAAHPPILVVDIETTSANRFHAGIVEIGAIWLHPAYGRSRGMCFEMKCRPRPDAEIDPDAIAVNGCDWLLDPTVASESEAIERFADWIADSLHMEALKENALIMAGMNVGVFDWLILKIAFHLANIVFPFSFRTIDLHSIAMREAMAAGIDDIGGDGMSAGAIFEMLALPAEPKPHRALCGALLEHRALWDLLGPEPPPVHLGELEDRFFTSSARGGA